MFNRQNKTKPAVASCAVFLSWFLCFFFVSSCFVCKSAIDFRIGTLRVLLSQILNFTTSDTRQDGQPSPFTTSSSQRVRGMRNCWASIVAETENPFLMEHQRLYLPLAAVCFLDSRKFTLDCFDRRPIQNHPLVETKATRLSIARTRHAHVHDVSYCCCCAARLYT